MAQFGAAKNPPWARQSDFSAVTVPTSIPANMSQPQVANTILQPQVQVTPTVYSMGNATQNVVQPQYTAQQLAAMGLQAQQQAVAALQQQAQVIPQPGIAIPTSLATSQVATVSYPTPRATQNTQPKQRVFTGTISKLHDNFGFVDEDVFFQTSCVKGPIPKVNDRVLVEATFNPNMPFKWNATRIQVLPNQGAQNNQHSNVNKPGFGMQQGNQVAGGFGGPPGPQPLMQQGFPSEGMISQQNAARGSNNSSVRRNERFERERERKRDREKRERPERPSAPRKRSRSKSPVKRAENTHQRSPARRRPRIVPRYVVQVPKLSFDMKETNVVSLKSRYTNLYIPSDFFNASFTWTEAFPLHRPFQLGNHCDFHVVHRDVESITQNDAVLDPQDSDHLYSAKVMLLSCPSLEDLFHKSCALAEDPPDVQESFVHPTRLIHFLVGLKGKNETMAIGGPWSPSLDGLDPADNPKVLIKTAIRTTRALTGIDLSGCTQWYRFAEVRYLRPEETHKGKLVPARVETTVIFLPDVWSCNPTRLEWGSLQAAYKKQLQKKVMAINKEGTTEANSQEEEEAEGEISTENKDPTHFSELDPKTMKIIDLRKELESRSLSSKGLKSQLIARLTKSLKSEQEKEEEQEAMETQEEEATDEAKKNLEDEKNDEKKKEEEEKKKKDEREKASLERKYALPDNPMIIVHPNAAAKGGKFDCSVMSLSVLLDYRPEDNKEHSFEVSLFAELFNEMLMRDFGFEIYKGLVKAPEKKEEEKKDKEKDKDKDKKTDDKSNKDQSSAKKKKTDEKDKKDSEKKDKDSKDKDKKKEKEEERKEKDSDKKDDDDDTDDDGKKEKEKKREKKKYFTREPALLLAYTYFDQNHTGYILEKNVEEVIHAIGLQLSRAQVKKLVQKLVSRDALNYRKITDKPVPSASEKEEQVEEKEIKIAELIKLANGNSEYLGLPKKEETSNVKSEVELEKGVDQKAESSTESAGFITYKGAMIDVDSVMQRLEKSEKTRAEMERQMQELNRQTDHLKKNLDTKEDKNEKLTTELKQLKQRLLVQEKITNNSESTSKKYLSALVESKEHLAAMLTVVTDALGEEAKLGSSESVKKDPDQNGIS